VATEALPTARGTMMSSNFAALAGGRAIGTLLGGWLFRTGGYALNGTLALLLNLIAALLIWRFVREYASHKSVSEAEPLP
jgi:predicted MFS family arabinose efflux permease